MESNQKVPLSKTFALDANMTTHDVKKALHTALGKLPNAALAGFILELSSIVPNNVMQRLTRRWLKQSHH